MKSLSTNKVIYAFLLRLHYRISSFVARLIGPMVFNFGTKQPAWHLKRADLLQFPEGTVGRAVGEFLAKDNLELLERAEYHDVHHVLFDFSNSLKDEIALQFFLRGNGNHSLASCGTAVGGWFVLPFHWRYLRACYRRGKKCADVSGLNTKEILGSQLSAVRSSLFESQSSVKC